jgi:hypothetical protein
LSFGCLFWAGSVRVMCWCSWTCNRIKHATGSNTCGYHHDDHEWFCSTATALLDSCKHANALLKIQTLLDSTTVSDILEKESVQGYSGHWPPHSFVMLLPTVTEMLALQFGGLVHNQPCKPCQWGKPQAAFTHHAPHSTTPHTNLQGNAHGRQGTSTTRQVWACIVGSKGNYVVTASGWVVRRQSTQQRRTKCRHQADAKS